VGNCLHKTAALSGLAAVVTGLLVLYVIMHDISFDISYINVIMLNYNSILLHRLIMFRDIAFQDWSGVIGLTSAVR